MTNFYEAYDQLPRSKSPSRRYPQFITAFEKLVEQAQEGIKKSGQLERPYNVISEALEKLNISNDGGIDISNGEINITFSALPTNSKADLDDIAEKIGKALLQANLHKDGNPSVSTGTFYPSFNYLWRINGSHKVSLSFDISKRNGLKDYRVQSYEQAYTSTLYKIVPRSEAPSVESQLGNPWDGGYELKINIGSGVVWQTGTNDKSEGWNT